MLSMGKKPPTPQELYRARKQREEEERTVYLPPGLYNHGNTCFMNSVLQGLVATPMLSDIIRFTLPVSYLPVASRRSPQLTNGHGRGGSYEHEWEQGMPLGDVFVRLMEKAWKAQDDRTRTNLSPKELLTRLGAKYDQYLDFRQQDAHELLRHLLDAMRMEELDIIKKRQPPPQKVKKKSIKVESDTNGLANQAQSNNDSPSAATQLPEEEKLISFVDMVFGGQLASILVCQNCKKVSCTYEDFNDLSLSIKAEDYVKERKRDRLKNFARRLKIPSPSATALDSSEPPRSSSVPVSPTRRSLDSDGAPEHTVEQRRSLEADNEVISATDKNVQQEAEKVHLEEKKGPADLVEVLPAREGTTSAIAKKSDGSQSSDKVSKDDRLSAKDNIGESWTKLGRRISMGLKRGRGKDMNRHGPRSASESVHKEGNKTEALIECNESDIGETLQDTPTSVADSPDLTSANRKLAALPSQTVSTSAPNTPMLNAKQHTKFGFHHRPSPSRTNSSSTVPSRPSSPSLYPVTTRSSRRPASPLARAKSVEPPKLSREESEYLSRLLSDIPSSSSSPFHLLRGPLSSSSPDFANIVSNNSSTSLWQKLGNVQSVEDCLRMFTAVEVLDEENMVGCRRCWKIANGEYVPRGRKMHPEANIRTCEAESSSSSTDEENDEKPAVTKRVPEVPSENEQSEDVASPATTPLTSLSPQLSRLDLTESSSIKSAPNVMQTPSTSSLEDSDEPTQRQHHIYAGMMVPSISIDHSAPQSPEDSASQSSSPTVELAGVGETPTARVTTLPQSSSRDSLMLPSRHVRRPADRGGTQSSPEIGSDQSSDDSGDESEASVQSDTSSHRIGTPSTAPTAAITLPDQPSSHSSTKVPRSKQVIFRRAYKRYLVAKPPPVLVIHLKRFQQVNKGPVQFFANFKKLDDAVSFPEYLDLTPFLLPRREDFGIGKVKKSIGLGIIDKEKEKEKPTEKCMYRLYAVVVHIGNMLGGHYIAYTALPNLSSVPSSAPDSQTNTSEMQEPPVPPAPISRTATFEKSAETKTKQSHGHHHHLHHERKWCYISDTTVKLTTLSEVLKAKAYICMYERI